MSVLLFAPSGDEPLRGTRWIAEQTGARLASVGLVSHALFDRDATRAQLEEHLATHATGLVAVCHGGRTQLLGTDRAPVLDEHNAHHTSGKWVHAIACLSGQELARIAVDRGATCFAAYVVSLILEWDPDGIAAPIREAFSRLVTGVSLSLALGERDLSRLLSAILPDQEAVIAWCDQHPDLANGLEITAQQLVSKLVFLCDLSAE